jgi:nucleotide-binding universal stress UspA family protein
LKREESEARGFVSNVERFLVAVDASPSGQFASRVIGLLAGARRTPTTVLHFDYASAKSPDEGARQADRTKTALKESAEVGDVAAAADIKGDRPEITTRVEQPTEDVIEAEAKKGYGLLLIGREPASEGPDFHDQMTRSAARFGGPFAIAIARAADRENRSNSRFDILVPVTGTAVSRHGAEMAVALAQASRGTITALHVDTGQMPRRSLGRRFGAALAPRSGADAIIREVVQLGDQYGIEVKGAVRSARSPADAIQRQLVSGRHNVLVIGVSPRPGEILSFGQVAAELLDKAQCSLLFVASEPFVTAADQEASDPKFSVRPPQAA